MTHPSFLVLNRAAVGTPPADAGAAAHLETCAACAAYISRMQVDLPPPAWALALADEKPRRARWLKVLLPLSAALAAVVLVVLPSKQPPAFTAKGAPSVAVYVKRGEAVNAWDGGSPLRPGDRLQLQLAPEEFRFALVASLSDPAAPQILYSGKLPRGPSLLPVSFRVDDSPGPEQLLVVLATSPVFERDLTSLAKARRPDVWTLRLVLPKERR